MAQAAEHEAQKRGPSDRVRVLSTELANQIAAGEVIERPASAVKELVENSLDAESTQIFVDIQDGGRQLIRVTDNGLGMSRADAVRAIERHATSKIRTVDDLFAISTLGFRGEALPSIASVSRFTLMTQEADALSGTRLEIEGGQIKDVRDAGLPRGTCIEVRDLFFNTPARLKFLKTTATEVRHISEAMLRVAIAHPKVHVRLTHNGRKLIDLPGNTSLGDRLHAVFGQETRQALFPSAEYPPIDGVWAEGFYSRPDFTQRTTSQFYVYVNGRYVKDSTAYAAIKSAYRGMLEKGRYPMVVLFVHVPPDLVDVNVHPTKIEVRFTKSDAVFRAVYHAVHDALQDTPWVEDVGRTYTLKPRNAVGGKRAGAAIGPDQATFDPLDVRDAPRQGDLSLGREGRRPGEPLRMPIAALFGPAPKANAAPADEDSGAETFAQAIQASNAPSHPFAPGAPMGRVVEIGDAASEAVERPEEVGYFSRLQFIGQFRKLYLICADASGLVIVDQHAAHERIGFERLRAAYRAQTRERQPLLVSQRLVLDTLRAAAMREHAEFFDELGFEIEPFGGNDFALKAVPAMLVGADYGRMVKDALDDLSSLGRTDRINDAFDAIFARMACHAVIRAGDVLREEEAKALFAQMDAIDFGANCPHGRPVYYRLPVSELEEAFGRT